LTNKFQLKDISTIVLEQYADFVTRVDILGCANLKLSEYLHFRVREFKSREFKTE